MEVDAVEKRAGDFLAVGFDLARVAAAVAGGVAPKAAGAGIHGGDEEEFGGKAEGSGGAGDGDFAVLEGLAEDFEGGAAVFREFVEKEDAIVGERDFAGAGISAAAEEADVGNGVVRRAEGTAIDKALTGVEEAGDRVNLRGLDGFGLGHVGHDGGHAFGEHGLAGAGRADHEDVVATGGGDFEGAFDVVLALDLVEVGSVFAVVALDEDGAGFGSAGVLASDEFPGFAEGLEAVNFQVANDGGFAGIFFGEQEATTSGGLGSEGDGEGSSDRAEGAIEGEFADDHEVVGLREGFLFLAGDHGEGDGEIEGGALFFEVGGGEIDGVDAVGVFVSGGENSGGNAVAGFADGGVREADDIDAPGVIAISLAGGDFNLDLDRFDTTEGGAVDFGNHGLIPYCSERQLSGLFCAKKFSGRALE